MKLHELSVRRPVCVTMIVLIFVIIGGYALTMLPMELMPEMEMPMAIVMTNYNNVGAEEVESLVTETIENACASVSGIDTMQSMTSEGSSIIMLQFHTGTDMDKAVSDVEDSIDMIADYLPEKCNDPMVIKRWLCSALDTKAMTSYRRKNLLRIMLKVILSLLPELRPFR